MSKKCGAMLLVVLLSPFSWAMQQKGSRLKGIDLDNVYFLQLLLPRDRYPDGNQRCAFLQQALNNIRALPGVESVAAIDTAPTKPAYQARAVRSELGIKMSFRYSVVTPDYFRVVRLPLQSGRYFKALCEEGIAVLNEGSARKLFPDSDPLGKCVFINEGDPDPPCSLVVGVVADIEDPEKERPEIYVPYGHYTALQYSIAVRVAPGVEGMVERVKAEIKAIDEQLEITDAKR